MRIPLFLSDKVDWICLPEVNSYDKTPPFAPPFKYPELPFISTTNKESSIYPMVRELLKKMEMDKEHIGSVQWNPFKDLIKPGDKVLIKPNLVTHSHCFGKDAILSTIVHGSIIRPIIDYIYLALDGKGSITIADTPIESSDFDEIMLVTGIRKMVDELKRDGYNNLWIIDLRPEIAYEQGNGELVRQKASGDPLGYVSIDLARESCFHELDSKTNIHYYTLADRTVNHLNPREDKKSITDAYHNSNTHRYLISKIVLDSDVIINIAKMKTHCKAGVSMTLKNMIGIVSTKDCMPHHRPGPPPEGDAFPDYPASYYVESRKLYRSLRRLLHIHKFPGIRFAINTLRRKKIIVGQQIEHGNWKGNDTIWRTILDVNRIALYADNNGVMHEQPQRRFLGLIDGIIGQHGDAPICGTPINCAILLGGYNQVVLDAFAAKAMGIEYKKIKSISEATKIDKWRLVGKDVDLSFNSVDVPNLDFVLAKGWE